MGKMNCALLWKVVIIIAIFIYLKEKTIEQTKFYSNVNWSNVERVVILMLLKVNNKFEAKNKKKNSFKKVERKRKCNY